MKVASGAPAGLAVVEGAHLVLTTGFENAVAVQGIPGIRYDSQRRQWMLPGTPRHAVMLLAALPGLTLSDAARQLVESDRRPMAQAVSNTTQNSPATSCQEVRKKADLPLPAGVATQAWKHQVSAYRLAMKLLTSGGGGCLLAIRMGGGKTLVAIMVMAGTGAARILIVCPLRVVPVWTSQIKTHLTTPVVIAALHDKEGKVRDRQRLAQSCSERAQALRYPFVCIINFDSVWREDFSRWALKQTWDLVIVDESHRIKKPGGRASLFFKRLRSVATRRLALTGTPMPHSPLDIYSQFRFLNPNVFGPSYAAFRQRYAIMGGFQNKQVVGFHNLSQLEKKLQPYTFRVDKDVLDLPPETHVVYECDLSPEARKVYSDLEKFLIAEIGNNTVTAANAMVKLLRLQQLTGGYLKTDDGRYHRVDRAKQDLLLDTLSDLGQEPAVVFCRYHADLDAVHECCNELGSPAMELSGRQDDLERWQKGDGQVLAVQISAGGVGVDLTRACYSVYYSLSFSLGEYEQALSRVHRPGQTRPVTHIHLVAERTIDARIMRALEKRAEVVNAILDELRWEQAA